MKHRSVILSMFTAAFLAASALAEPPTPGIVNFTFDATHRDRIVQALVTYPSVDGGFPEYTGGNAVFKGTHLQRDAKPERKKHPLIIFSHGSGGNAANATWLTKKLAENGYVVIAPNHQGSTSSDSRPETTIPATWERKQDMTAMLDAIAASPTLSALIDLNDITIIGFSLGGHTALGLVGAQINAKALADNCESANPMPGCEWLQHGNGVIKGNVDLRKIDSAKFNAAYFEPRIKRVAAIDPGFTQAYETSSLASIKVPTFILNLGAKGETWSSVEAEQIAAAIPGGQFDRVEGANHFSFLTECKWLGGILVWYEGDDPVCTETGDRSRAEYHEIIASKLLDFLKDVGF
jgi:predicted dienelactone hydrolase